MCKANPDWKVQVYQYENLILRTYEYYLTIDIVISCCKHLHTFAMCRFNNMDSFLISAVIIALISSAMVLGGLLSISFLQLPTIRKNMRREAEEQMYAKQK
ncbi:MAG: hypothetical protein WAK17_17540 [Candidatus Nitrosopolaris sp.]